MNNSEVVKLIFTIKATYPKYYSNFTKSDYDNLRDSWVAIFGNYTYEQASRALYCYMQNDNGFPPTPGQIIQWINKMSPSSNDNYPTAQEAWECLIDDYVSCSGDYKRAKENYESMPVVLKKCVGGADALNDMALMDVNTLNSVEKSHFIKTYNAVLNDYKERVKMRQSTNGISQKENIGIEG